MIPYRKLKPDQSITGLLPAIVAITALIIANIFWGKMMAFKTLAVILLIMAIMQYFAFSRVRSLSYFISATYILSAGLFLFFGSFNEPVFPKGEYSALSKFLAFTTIFLLVWLIYLLLTRKTKWKGREVLELAAMPVEETSDGFTARPRPAGKIAYSKHDLLAFADFLRKNHISLPLSEKDRNFPVPVMMSREFTLLYSLRPQYLDRSWVAFSYNGDVSVHISKKDYLLYKDQLSFDRLCDSMGELFKEFFTLFLNNDGVRIIDRLDSLKVSIFT